MTQGSDNNALAWGLTVAASSSTLIGSLLVIYFVRSGGGVVDEVRLRSVSACSLGAAAGVMLFVSVAELFSKSEERFSSSGGNTDRSDATIKLFATLSFFLGAAIAAASSFVAKKYLSGHHMGMKACCEEHHQVQSPKSKRAKSAAVYDDIEANSSDSSQSAPSPETEKSPLDALRDRLKASIRQSNETKLESIQSNLSLPQQPPAANAIKDAAPSDNSEGSQEEAPDKSFDPFFYSLGLTSCFAIALHNLPEGIAAFLSTILDGRDGMAIAFGVILHNIPEGLCVAFPMCE